MTRQIDKDINAVPFDQSGSNFIREHVMSRHANAWLRKPFRLPHHVPGAAVTKNLEATAIMIGKHGLDEI